MARPLQRTPTTDLLNWVQTRVNSYKNVNVTNFTKSWADGMAFCALVHHWKPELLDFSACDPKTPLQNLQKAFAVMDKFGIKLLDAEDTIEIQDSKSIMAQVMMIQKKVTADSVPVLQAKPVLQNSKPTIPTLPPVDTKPKPTSTPTSVTSTPKQPKPSSPRKKNQELPSQMLRRQSAEIKSTPKQSDNQEKAATPKPVAQETSPSPLSKSTGLRRSTSSGHKPSSETTPTSPRTTQKPESTKVANDTKATGGKTPKTPKLESSKAVEPDPKPKITSPRRSSTSKPSEPPKEVPKASELPKEAPKASEPPLSPRKKSGATPRTKQADPDPKSPRDPSRRRSTSKPLSSEAASSKEEKEETKGLSRSHSSKSKSKDLEKEPPETNSPKEKEESRGLSRSRSSRSKSKTEDTKSSKEADKDKAKKPRRSRSSSRNPPSNPKPKEEDSESEAEISQKKSNSIEDIFARGNQITDSTITPSKHFKIVTIGDSGVGKSSILHRWDSDTFRQLTTTLNLELMWKTFHIKNEFIRFQLWDTAGQERFRSLTNQYYRGAAGAIIVFDITRQSSFDSIKSWKSDVLKMGDPKIKFLLIGNKSDLYKQREVTTAQATSFAKKNNMMYLEVSAKKGENVDRAIAMIMQEVYLDMSLAMDHEPQKPKQTTPGNKKPVLTKATIILEQPAPADSSSSEEDKGGCC